MIKTGDTLEIRMGSTPSDTEVRVNGKKLEGILSIETISNSRCEYTQIVFTLLPTNGQPITFAGVFLGADAWGDFDTWRNESAGTDTAPDL